MPLCSPAPRKGAKGQGGTGPPRFGIPDVCYALFWAGASNMYFGSPF